MKKKFTKLYVAENLRRAELSGYDVLDGEGRLVRQFRRYGDARRFALREAMEAFAGRPSGAHVRLRA